MNLKRIRIIAILLFAIIAMTVMPVSAVYVYPAGTTIYRDSEENHFVDNFLTTTIPVLL